MNKTVFMKISEIRPLPYEPDERLVMDDRMRDLVSQIKKRVEAGKDALPESERLLIGRDGVLGDGHRRKRALETCGIEYAWVEIDEERTGVEIFSHRAGSKPMSSKVVVQASKKGLPIEYFPIDQKNAAYRIINAVGRDVFDMIIEGGISIGGIYSITKRVMRYCGRSDNEFMRAALLWMLTRRGQRLLVMAMDDFNIPAITIIDAIENDTSITLTV